MRSKVNNSEELRWSTDNFHPWSLQKSLITDAWQAPKYISVTRCAICYHLYYLKNVKHPWRSVTFSKVLLKVTFLNGCFMLLKLCKWYQIAQNITYLCFFFQSFIKLQVWEQNIWPFTARCPLKKYQLKATGLSLYDPLVDTRN